METEEYNALYPEVNKLKALGDVLRWNASKLQNDTVENIGGLIFDISKCLLERLHEMHGSKEEALGRSETYVI
ncbi:MAG TPA: hypothetical protein EYP21_00805 [Syntrophaceae bacterium]|nr:hypothetical protein [Syntrophaceae bacterium]